MMNVQLCKKYMFSLIWGSVQQLLNIFITLLIGPTSHVALIRTIYCFKNLGYIRRLTFIMLLVLVVSPLATYSDPLKETKREKQSKAYIENSSVDVNRLEARDKV